MNELINYQCTDGIATLQLNNGKVNALSPALIQQFNSCLDQAEQDKAIVIITGQPGIFSGGYDLKVMLSGPANAIDLVAQGSDLTRRMLAHPQPIIIACSGHAIAKGAFLLLAADYRIATAGDFTIALNEVEIGMVMHQAGIVLAQGRLTPAAFQRAVNNAERFTPEAAVSAGFVDQVVHADELINTAQTVAQTMKKLNMRAHYQTKLKVRQQQLADLEAAIEQDKVYASH